MQHYLFILFQIDEARRYILGGRLEQLRLALLLLDNAAELQLYRRIQTDLELEEIQELLLDRIQQIPENERSPDLVEAAKFVPLEKREKERVNRYFHEKLAYLSDRQSCLDPSIVSALAHLHHYRNEAYHSAKVRKETIYTASVILLDINCQLLLTLDSGGGSYHSGDDYSWIKERFGLESVGFLFERDFLNSIVEEFRSDILPKDESIIEMLADHILCRFEDLYESLDSIVATTGCENRTEALRASQSFFQAEKSKMNKQTKPDTKSVTFYNLEHIEKLQSRASLLCKASARLEAFQQFSSIEKELELIEEPIHAFELAIDRWIQREVDRLRGK